MKTINPKQVQVMVRRDALICPCCESLVSTAFREPARAALRSAVDMSLPIGSWMALVPIEETEEYVRDRGGLVLDSAVGFLEEEQ